MEATEDGQVDDFLEVGPGQVVEALSLPHGCVVHKDIDAAEFCDRRLRQPFDIIRIAAIGNDRDRLPTRVADSGGDLFA